MFRKVKDYFFRGIAVLLPTILTIWVFVQCYRFVQDNVSAEVSRALVKVVVTVTKEYPHPTADEIRDYAVSQNESLTADPQKLELAVKEEKIIDGARIEKAKRYWVHGPGQIAGFILAIIAVIFVGAILASVVGRALWRRLELFLLKLPLVKKVYPYIKQITDFMFTKNKLTFTRVAAIEYPRKGLWSVALVTGDGLQALKNANERELVTVFIPSSPTPFTGYVITVPKEDVMLLDMSIEEALRFTVSGGVITPSEHEKFEKQKELEDKKQNK